MMTISQALRLACENGAVHYVTHYCEPSYTSRENNGILLADWNPQSFERDAPKSKRIMSRLGALAERAGYEIEWVDEWTTCDSCYGAVRTSPDSYSWRRSYADCDGEVVCAKCLEPTDYLESIEGQSDRAVTFDLDLTEYGYKQVNGEFESGWHPGQNDSPHVIARDLRKRGVNRFLFSVDSVGQFDMNFSLWVHEDEFDLLGSDEVASKLPYDPGTEISKALRGESTPYYRTETRTITTEEFIKGDWTD